MWKYVGIGGVVLGCLAGLIFFLSSQRGTPPHLSQPHVIVILLDAARADHFPCYGYDRQTVPSIQHYLVATGTVFLQGFAAGSATRFTMPALFTGKLAYANGYAYPTGPLPQDNVTLAEHLKQRGYLTYGIVTNPNLNPKYQFDQGFTRYDTLEAHYKPYPRASLVVDKAVAFLREARDQPVFLYLHFMDPHGPYLPPAPFDTVFTSQGVTPADVELNKVVWRDLHTWRQQPIEERRKVLQPQRLIDLYDGELRYVDHELGRLFEALERQRLFSETLIVLTADHGEEFLEHGYAAHLNIPYEELLHVPFIVKLPASFTGKRKTVSVPVHATLDVLPTILDIIDGSQVETDGESLLPFMAQDNAAVPERLKQRLIVADNPFVQVARKDKWKYIGSVMPMANPEAWASQLSFLNGELLFNLEADPGETTNLISVYPDRAAVLKAELRTFLTGSAAAPRSQGTVSLDPNERQRLRSLGYLQ